MALTTKRKPSTHTKKRQAQHHRHNRVYIKTYWPYLPIFAIMAAGVAIDRSWQPEAARQATASSASVSSARLEALMGVNSSMTLTFVLVTAVAALAFFLTRHSIGFHKMVVKGEYFMSQRPLLDIAAVAVFTTGFVLIGTR